MKKNKQTAGVKDTPKKKIKRKKKEEVPFHKQPEAMSLELWQAALRKQFAQKNEFVIEKKEGGKVYGDYTVFNPETRRTYRVALRTSKPGGNFCSCLDFKISRLGTCKHIEAVFYHIRKKRLAKYLREPYVRQYSSVYVNYAEGRTIQLRIGEENKADLTTLAKPYFDEKGQLTEYGFEYFDNFIEKAKSLNPDFRCYDDAFDLILERRELLKRRKKLQNLAPQFDKVLGELIKVPLFPYQTEGVFYAAEKGRVIIGDEMGLGKTIQAITTAEVMRRYFGIEKVVVLCPASLKYQWQTEIDKFTGQPSKVIEGNFTTRSRMYAEDNHFYKIAGYHSVLSDADEIDKYEPDLVILDEAQRIKNWRTKIAQNVRRINARFILVLTGTPIENNLEELYGLVQFVDPFALGPRHYFFRKYQEYNDNGKVIGYRNLSEIRLLLKDCLIRRVKKEVLKQLPKRTDKNLIVAMTEEQRTMHREYSDQVAKLVHKWQKIGFLDEKDRQKLLKFLNLMRMVCDSTYIVDQNTNHQTKLDELVNLLEQILEIDGEKVVIFSQWERMTSLIASDLQELGVGYRYLHGGVPSALRGELYTTFNNDPDCRVFLSTDAGGVGLNLQSAAWLINMDIPWNPGVLEQRIGRIYRLGQEKPVTIINLVSQGTIEHNLLSTIQFKKSMAAGVLDGGEDTIFMGDSKFRKFMESVEELTQQQTDIRAIREEDIEQPEFVSDDEPEADASESAFEENIDPAELVDLPPLSSTAEDEPLKATPSPPKVQQPDISTEQFPPKPATHAAPTPHALVQNGLQFFSQLAQTLSDKKATENLVSSIVQKDEATGQTYLKLPVESEEVVKNTLSLLSGLLKGLSGQ